MGKRIVIALGGNALGSNLPEQMIAVKQTAKAIVDLIEEGHEVIIAHGNGPQVGMIQKAMAELTRSEPEKYIPCPLSVCVAMSQGYIGYDLQNALREELLDRGIQKGVATVLTQVEVDPNDEAFQNPTKPIGAFMTKEEADKMVSERGYNVIEDAGRGYRRVVASPRPQSIIEIQSIRDMVEAGLVVVACGGGGIPVYKTEGHHLKGAAAVIDKDFASCVLAQQVEADKMVSERGYNVIEDAGRGYRRVVASPRPQSIIEIQSIRDMVEAGLVVVACGGGGIPVYKTEGHHLKGAAAVIDKDFASCVLAQQVEADTLIILTAVEKVAINFGKPDEKWLDSLTPDEARKYIGEGHFAPGSMLPKVEAAVEFAESAPGRSALITLLEKAKDGVAGKTGTAIHQ